MVMLSKTCCHTVVAVALALSFQWSLHAAELVTPARLYVPGDGVPTAMSIPPNLVISDIYRPLLERMLRGSRTFRRQCVRLAAEPRWIVYLRIRSSAPRHGVRALTSMNRSGEDGMTANVEIFENRNDVELIAHEIEHVLERIDGVDLRSLANVSDSGVRALDMNQTLYETRRANRIGAIVSREMMASTSWW